MTDNQDDKKKKLTLGGSKLNLGSKLSLSKKFGKNLNANSPVVVEVTGGKADSKKLSLGNKPSSAKISKDQEDRRLAALEKSKQEKTKSNIGVTTLSKIAEMNQIKDDSSKKLDEVLSENQDNSDGENNKTSKLNSNDHLEENEQKSNNEKSQRSSDSSSLVEKQAKEGINSDIISKNRKEKPSEDKEVSFKPKVVEPKKLKKSDIMTMLDSDSGDGLPFKTHSLAALKRKREKEKRKASSESVKVEKVYREVIIPENITVSELSNRMTERSSDVIRELMKLGVMANSSQSIDSETAELIATSFGHSVKHVKESDIEDILIEKEDAKENLKVRAPIVTVMGHVDHGKTSLLDALKSTDIVADEVGGITQHIGAYSVTMSDGRMITFIDTPGHEAFTQMRTRGSQVTDIVVLVVAADDGIKAQTIEAISHAKAADVPIIVAINKIDKEGADIDRVKNELLVHELIPEDLGGDIITVPVSAIQRKNLDKLEESILLIAEMQELKTNHNSFASGVVVESRVDPSRGVVATLIVQRGTLNKGDIVLAGNTYGRVKRICNHKGRTIQEAGPSLAVEIYGLNEAPLAGDVFNVTQTDKQARDIAEYRLKKQKGLKSVASASSMEDMFLKASGKSKIKELPLIIKGDVHGSIEAIINSLNKIVSDEVKIRVLHSGVGGITESDISLANASGALVIGFNVRANNLASTEIVKNKVDVRYYSIIYNLIDDVKSIMSGMLSPTIREEYIGSVDIREVFNISKVGKIAGSYVTKGIIKRGAGVRLLRDNIVIHEGKLKTLKRFKEDVKEVREGYECGIAFENYNDIKIGDSVEVFEIVEEKKTL